MPMSAMLQWHSQAVAIKSVLYWIVASAVLCADHTWRCSEGAGRSVMRMIGKPALVCREKCPSCIHIPHRMWIAQLYSENSPGEKTRGLGGMKHTDIGAAMYWGVCIQWSTHCESSIAKDCTVVYGDRRGIASATTVLDAGAVHGL